MPIDKATLVLPTEFMVDPKGSYTRIARVMRVYLTSRQAEIEFLDGDMEAGQTLEARAVATVVAGSPFPPTTYAPSAAVYGRGDVVCVLVLRSGELLIISPADMYGHLDRQNYALIKGWALFDVLNGVLVDWVDNGAGSYISMWAPDTYVTTTIWGDPDKHTIMRRLLEYFCRYQQACCDIASMPSPTNFERLGTGPATNLQTTRHGKQFNGRYVNGFPFVEDDLFANDSTLAADYSMYSSVLTNQFEASVHPLRPLPNRIMYQGGTVLWLGDEEDPDYVLVACCFPSWELAPYIQFIEVPVHCLAGRKLTERDEDGEIMYSWQQWGEHARLVWTIPRDYIPWSLIGTTGALPTGAWSGDLVMRAPRVHTPRMTGGNSTVFGIIDSCHYEQGGVLFPIQVPRSIVGQVTRYPLSAGSEAYPNGSRHQYIIEHNNPSSSGLLDNSYDTRFEWEWVSGSEMWERQTSPPPADPQPPPKEYLCYTDGVNTMHRTLFINYYVEGEWLYDEVYAGGMISWSQGGTTATSVMAVDNYWEHRLYRNDVLLWIEHFRNKKVGNYWTGDDCMVKIHYADVPYNLFVIEKIEHEIFDETNIFGPGHPAEGVQTRTGIVIFNGQQYVIWHFTRPLTTFPTVYNYHPWVRDGASICRPPADKPYSVDQIHTGWFMWQPHHTALTPPIAEYAEMGWAAPTPQFDCGSMNFKYMADKGLTPRYYYPADHLQVSIHSATNSFAVRFRCHLETFGGAVISYPNGGNTLLQFNGGTPHFNIPETNENIVL